MSNNIDFLGVRNQRKTSGRKRMPIRNIKPNFKSKPRVSPIRQPVRRQRRNDSTEIIKTGIAAGIGLAALGLGYSLFKSTTGGE